MTADLEPLPQGTLTMLFTDIEHSTRVLQHLGDEQYAGALAAQRELLRAAFAARGGRELGTEGDSFFVVFPSAREAVAAVAAAQRALAAHPWPRQMPVRVRMGLHTGQPTLAATGYVGLDVHRAARISNAAHGGQVLLSQATCDLVRESLPPGTGLRFLGSHRLKDLSQPERLHQLLFDDLPNEFPSVRSLDAHPNNLPPSLTSFIGREEQLDHLRRLLRGESSPPLVTLTGPGGSGKTRLALRIAGELLEGWPDGVWFVGLAALDDPALVPQAVATALRLREQPGQPLAATLVDYLGTRELLLILDNCEHVVAACAALAETLLRECPRVRVLATSREALAIAGEVVVSVPPLPLPAEPPPLDGPCPAPDDLMRYESVRLFLDRAVLSRPGFVLTPANAPAVARLCRRLDGIPLALELAAARVKLLSIEQVATRLEDRFRLLTGGARTAPPRHQTLRAAIDWSHELLPEAERVLLRRLSVFAGGFTLEAAEAVCADEGSTNDQRPTTNGEAGPRHVGRWSLVVGRDEVLDLLEQLVNKSLVDVDESGDEPRYRLLESIRQYGQERLGDSEEVAPVRRRHLAWCLQLAERAEPELVGAAQAEWLDRLDRDHDNLRAALAFDAADGEGETWEEGLRLAGALWRFWRARCYFSEGRQHLARLLSRDASAPPATGARDPEVKNARARALNGAGILAWDQGDYEAARTALEACLAIRRELGDRQGIAGALGNLGLVAHSQGAYDTAWARHEESLAIQRALNDRRAIAASLNNLASVTSIRGDLGTTRALLEESLAIRREIGDRAGMALALANLGETVCQLGDVEAGQACYQESLTTFRELGNRLGIARCLSGLGAGFHVQGELDPARAALEESLAIHRDLGDKQGAAEALLGLGLIAIDAGDGRAAVPFLQEGQALLRELGDRTGTASALEVGAELATLVGEMERACCLYAAAERIREALGAPRPPRGQMRAEQRLATLREAMGEEAFSAAWDVGRAMADEEAIALALPPTTQRTLGPPGG
jgi:predicted ATPase/class 3 adenylate cyclase